MGVTEPTTGTDTTKIKTTAVKKGDRYIINGQKVWISRVEQSDLMILLARTTALADVKKKSEELSIFIVDIKDAKAKGMTARSIPISMQSDCEWVKLAETFLGQTELANDPRFATNVVRVNNRLETDAIVGAGFERRSLVEATSALLEADIAFASVNDMEGPSKHPHLRRITVDTPRGLVSYPAPAPIVDDQLRNYGAVPELGSRGKS